LPFEEPVLAKVCAAPANRKSIQTASRSVAGQHYARSGWSVSMLVLPQQFDTRLMSCVLRKHPGREGVTADRENEKLSIQRPVALYARQCRTHTLAMI